MKTKRTRYLICLAILIALLIPLGSVLAAESKSFEELFKTTRDSESYSVYKIEIEKTRLCTITYNPNNNDAPRYAPDVESNIPAGLYTIQDNMFTRNGMKFNGWNTAADGSGINYEAGKEITLDENMTFYAQWRHFTITFMPNTPKEFETAYMASPEGEWREVPEPAYPIIITAPEDGVYTLPFWTVRPFVCRNGAVYVWCLEPFDVSTLYIDFGDVEDAGYYLYYPDGPNGTIYGIEDDMILYAIWVEFN